MTQTISACNVLRHCIPDLLQEYIGTIIQKANTHSTELSYCSRHILLDLIHMHVLISMVKTMLGDFHCSLHVHVPASEELNFPRVTYM